MEFLNYQEEEEEEEKEDVGNNLLESFLKPIKQTWAATTEMIHY